ncbi:rhoGEF domain-containing protein [Ditylenchus destructor]|nr:rhoGEF domain-containing protein [Ditylenchus destructor]
MLRNFYEKSAYADFAMMEVLDKVKSEWSQLIGMTENRSKLINNSIIYYKCASHVMPASLYAQRTSDILLKYIRRCGAPEEHMLAIENEVMTFKQSVRERQARILELWVQRKARLEQCQQAVLLQISCAQICRWVAAETEHCVSMIGQARAATKASRNRNSVEDLMGTCTDFKTIEKRYEVKQMLQHASRFRESGPNEIHAQVIEQSVQSVRSRFKQILALSDELEAAITQARGDNNGDTTKEDLSLDRYSDSTIEEKMNHKEAVETVWNRKMMEPMNELIRSEKDYIEDLRKCMDIYIRGYQVLGSTCPSSLRNKQVEIFGNIDQLYEFHSKTFLSELLAYEKNPEDVGYCFIQWMEKLKELYADYCLNRDESNAIIGRSEAIKIFSDIRERHQLEPSHSLQSLLIKPVQRITRYRLMLEQLLKGSTANTKEIREAYEVVVNIPKLANDRMHLKNFESYELCEIHVVEHVEGDNTKFGLRKGAQPHQNDMTSVLKANSETTRMLWVKTLRDLKMDIKKPSIIDDRIPNFNRNSQVSRDSNTTTEDRNSIASTSSHVEQYVIAEDFVGTSSNANGSAMHDNDQQLSVKVGQRVEVLDRLPDNPEQFVAVAIVEEESGLPGQRRGLVPVRILQPANETPHQTATFFFYSFNCCMRDTRQRTHLRGYDIGGSGGGLLWESSLCAKRTIIAPFMSSPSPPPDLPILPPVSSDSRFLPAFNGEVY